MNLKVLAVRLLPLVYFLLVSFPHHYVSYLYDQYILVPLGMDAVQSYADMVSVAVLLLILGFALRLVAIQGRGSWRHLLIWAVTVLLMYAADRYLIVNNVERVHYPQYAVLAALMLISVRDPVLVFLVACFAGFIDEFQQYVTNPNHTNYLDFNDIVLNILGAALGLFMVLSLFKEKSSVQSQFERRLRHTFVAAASAVAAIAGLGLLFGRLVPYANVPKGQRHVLTAVQGKLSFILSFQNNGSFWTVADNGKSFHEMTTSEGVLVVLFLLVAFGFIIRWIAPLRGRGEFRPPITDP